MNSQNSHRGWSLLKYKEIKRSGREVYNDVRVLLDEPKRILTVFRGMEELERIYCNMEVSKFPCLKMKGPQLYVMVNAQSQGFRLTFRDEDRNQFMSTIRRIAYISETPEKNHLNRTFTNTGNWGTGSGKKKNAFTSSQPVSSSDRPVPSSTQRPAARNLANSLQSDFFTNRTTTSSFATPATFYSQPVHNPYSRPISSASSVSSSISSALSSLNDDSPFFNFSQSSRCSSYMSSPRSDLIRSPYSGSQVSDGSSYANLVSHSQGNSSQHSSDPFTQFSPPVTTYNKCVQTDGSMIDNLAKDPIFIGKFLERMVKSSKHVNLVRAMREQIRKLPPGKLADFSEKTKQTSSKDSALSSSIQPSMHHEKSDLEYDVFENA
ncbi:hypothetical protein L5515_011577 [Caenorhabditis briggsae]|uniref:Uncharacterized protein n=1 Tax=Caenorhabditis briggsae TaxID=6238 RepID=A0AAE9D4P5_CAEBR|nr:hypothetical protein L3Y34_004459 [Caenorhabditis briggsae]UMM28998.1 hypothetical protein L5515_011577 [Caenorhabditis briggsae]